MDLAPPTVATPSSVSTGSRRRRRWLQLTVVGPDLPGMVSPAMQSQQPRRGETSTVDDPLGRELLRTEGTLWFTCDPS